MGIYKQNSKDQAKGAKSSALKQLKQAIHKAGINSGGIHKGGLKKKQRAKLGGNKGNDDTYSKKVETIRDLFNPFEVKHNKVKNKIVGGTKQAVGKPTKSKQVGNDNVYNYILY
jgi:nucleolar protein 14